MPGCPASSGRSFGSTCLNTWNSISSPAKYSKPFAARRSSAPRHSARVPNGTGFPFGKYGSQSSQPVPGDHGSIRKLAGSATISASAPACISGIPNPPPGVKTGNTVLCEVSFAKSVVVTVTPSSSAFGSSAAVIVLPRRMPCWSANEKRTTSTPRLCALFTSSRAAARCSAVQRP